MKHNIKEQKMKQKGFAALAAVVLLAAVAVIVAGGYVVLKKQSADEDQQNIVTVETPSSQPNGTAENTVNAASQQLADEVASEAQNMEAEADETELDDASINELEGAINETNI